MKLCQNRRAVVYLYRAIDQLDQVIDVLVAKKRDLIATRRFFTRALKHGTYPTEVTTDRAPAYVRVLDEVLPGACHIMEQYANNPITPSSPIMDGSRLDCGQCVASNGSARHVISTGHAFVQNLRRGHYELGMDINPRHRLPTVFTELASAI